MADEDRELTDSEKLMEALRAQQKQQPPPGLGMLGQQSSGYILGEIATHSLGLNAEEYRRQMEQRLLRYQQQLGLSQLAQQQHLGQLGLGQLGHLGALRPPQLGPPQAQRSLADLMNEQQRLAEMLQQQRAAQPATPPEPPPPPKMEVDTETTRSIKFDD